MGAPKPKFSPGPWWTDLDDPPNVYVSSGDKEDVESIRNLVEMLRGGTNEEPDSRLPNAHLIAAAPDLYEALRRIFDEADNPHSSACAQMQDNIVEAHKKGRPLAACDCAVSLARAALAKARGES